MATISPNQSSGHSLPSKGHKWLLFLPILILLALCITLCPIYLLLRLNALETSLDQFKARAVQYKHVVQGLEDQVGTLSLELSNQKKKTMSQIQSELIGLRASVESSQLRIHQLTEVVEQYKRAYLQDIADHMTFTDKTINELAADMEAQKENFRSVAKTAQEHSGVIHGLQLGAQNLSQEMLRKHQQAVDLHTKNEQSINKIIEEINFEKELTQSLEDIRTQGFRTIKSSGTQNMPEERPQPINAGKAEEKKAQLLTESMNPFDSSDEDETLELRKKDEAAIAKLLEKASEKMQEGLKKGTKQMEKAMDKVKAVTKKIGEKVEGAGSRIGGKISSQVQRLVENGRKANEYIKSILEVSGRRGSDFDEDLEL